MQSSPVPAALPGSPRSLAAWLQFPRRALLLLIAYALCAGLLLVLRRALPNGGAPISAATGQPLAEILAERAPVTLAMLVAALALALLLAALLTALAVGLRRLRVGFPPVVGAGAGCLGKLVVYGLAALPPFALALTFLYVFAVRLGMVSAGSLLGRPEGAGRLLGIVLPALFLSLFPALVTAQAAIEALSAPGSRGRRLGRAALLALSTWVNQTGGLLSALVLLETVLARPGLGRLVVDSLLRRDLAVFVGALQLFAGMVLAARLLAELFNAAARLLAEPLPERAAVPEVAPPQPLRRLGLGLSLALLLVPLAFFAGGLFTPAERALETVLSDRNEPASAEHPWGTDSLGRDLRARVMRGALSTLGLATGVALLATLPALLGGALTSSLARRGPLWSDSAADVLLLPVDAVLLLPAVPAAMLAVLLVNGPGQGALLAAVALALLPRAFRAAHALWSGSPGSVPFASRVVAGLGGLLLATLFAGVLLVASLDLAGLGVPPPTPTLGGLMTEGLQTAALQPLNLLAPLRVLWLCVFALYAAAAGVLGQVRAVVGWFNT